MNSIQSSFCSNNHFVSCDGKYPSAVSIALAIITAAGVATGIMGICSYLPSYSIGIGFSISVITTTILLAQCCLRKKESSSNTIIGLQPGFNIEPRSYSEPVKFVVNREALSSQQNRPENANGFTSIEKELHDQITSKDRFLEICQFLSYKQKMDLLDRYYKIIISVVCKDDCITYSTHKCFKERFVELILTNEDLEKSDEFGRTLLLNTCLRNDFYMAYLLVKKGANTNVTDKDGRNILHLIAHHLVKQQVIEEPIYSFELSRRYTDWKQQLLTFLGSCPKGLGINQRDNYGETFIDILIKKTRTCECSPSDKNCSAIVIQIDTLALWKADFYSKDASGKTPLHYACEMGNIHLITLLIEEMKRQVPFSFDWRDNDGNTPLHLFIASKKTITYSGFFSRFTELYPQMFRIQNKKGQTCLHVIIQSGQSHKYLDKYNLNGASSLKDDQGLTALELACLLDDSIALKAFYDTLPFNELEKLFPFAIEQKKHSVIFELIKHRVPFKGAFYLPQALKVGHLPTVALLIHFRALNPTDFIYDDELQNLAKAYGLHEKLLKFCYQKNGNFVFQNLFEATSQGNENGVECYLNAGFDPNKFLTAFGNTILHLAAMTCQPNIIKKCANFISIDVKNYKSETALHLIATDKSHNPEKIEETIDALITSKANPNIENKEGYLPIELYTLYGRITALKALLKHPGVQIERTENSTNPSAFHLAVINGWVECATLLYEKGANINLLFLGDTPLHIAASCGRIDLLLNLIKWGAKVSIVDKNYKFYWHHLDNEDLEAFIEQLEHEIGLEKNILEKTRLQDARKQIDKDRMPQDFISNWLPNEISQMIFQKLTPTVSTQLVNKNWYFLKRDKPFT